MNHAATEVADAIESRGHLGDIEVGEGGGVAGTATALVDPEPEIVPVRLPARALGLGAIGELDAEHAAPEALRAFGIVGRELDQRARHAMSMPGYARGVEDLGAPIAYLAVERGSHVYDSGGDRIGVVERVIADQGLDIFEGLEVRHHEHSGRHLIADVDQIDGMFEQGIRLSVAAEKLREAGSA